MAAVLIIGAGANIGLSTAKRFQGAGYTVAIASRKAHAETPYKHFVFDAAQPTTVPKLFADVTAAVGAPSVVVWNAALGFPSDRKNPLALSLAEYEASMTVNATSVYVTAQEAVKGFSEASIKGTFIYTGNKLNVMYLPGMVIAGMGKSAVAHRIKSGAVGYKKKGYKFYYSDERKENGDPVYGAVDGEAHAGLYVELAEDVEQRPWLQTFVKGKGYRAFDIEETYRS